MFERQEYILKFDQKLGYYIDIYVEHQSYVGYRWDRKRKTQCYVFLVLAFGLSTACYVLTVLLRPLVRFWQGRSFKAIMYLDNGIVVLKVNMPP